MEIVALTDRGIDWLASCGHIDMAGMTVPVEHSKAVIDRMVEAGLAVGSREE